MRGSGGVSSRLSGGAGRIELRGCGGVGSGLRVGFSGIDVTVRDDVAVVIILHVDVMRAVVRCWVTRWCSGTILGSRWHDGRW